jgi:hypothetical protein
MSHQKEIQLGFNIVGFTKEQISLFIRCVMNNYPQELIKCIRDIKDIILYIKSLSKLEKKLQRNILSIGYILILFRNKDSIDYNQSLKNYLSYKFPNEKLLLDETFLDRLCRFIKLVDVDIVVSEMIGDNRKDYMKIRDTLYVQ